MPSIFSPSKGCHPHDIIQLCQQHLNLKFLLLVKKQKTTYFVKKISLFANFPCTKFWSNYITWLYIKRTKLHTKHIIHPPLFDPPLCSLSLSESTMFWNWIHLAAYVSKLFYTSPSPLQKYFFIDNNTTHILQHTIIHYPSFPHSIILKLHHFCCPKHISISFSISHTKLPF